MPTRVLLCDTADGLAQLQYSLLKSGAGLEMEVVTDGFRAVEVAARTQPSIVVAEIGLEGLAGSDLIRAAGRREGLTEFDWRLPDYPLERGPESEWGSEPGLAEALEAFATREGCRFIRIRLPDPHAFARLAFRAIGRQWEAAGRAPAGVLVEMFTQFDATAARRAGLLPLWLVFNTADALAFLRAMRPEFPAGRPVFFSPLATFSRTPDLAPWPEWEAALAGLDWRNVGARASHYPADARALVHWAAPLRRWADAHAVPAPPRLVVDELVRLAGF